MRLERGDLSIELDDEREVTIQRGDHPEIAVMIDLDELLWLITTAGPAAVAELRRGLEAAAPEPAPRHDDEPADGQPDLFAQANAELGG